MKVLMLTPEVVPEARQGFIVTWVNKLASKVDALHVVTLEYDRETVLPENVTVYNLGERKNKLTKYLYFSRIILNLLRKKAVDIVFCHMYAVFTFMVTPWVKPLRIPIIQWYAHGKVDCKLRMVHLLADKIVTSTKEGFRIKSHKVIITGQGIDTGRFRPAERRDESRNKHVILSVGRISPVKDYETLIRAADILVNKKGMDNLEFIITGGVPMPSQQTYYEKIVEMTQELRLTERLKFVGPIPHTEIVSYYQICDLFVSTSQTGSADKTTLEAMACEKLPLVCNESFKDILGNYSSILMFRARDAADLAQKIMYILRMNNNKRKALGQNMREIIKEEHSVQNLTEKLIEVFKSAIRK